MIDQGWRAGVRSLREGVGHLWANLGGYGPFLTVGGFTAVTGYALNSWSVSLFVRLQHIPAADAGKLIGIIGILAGPLGTVAGGVVLDRLRARGVAGAPLVVMAAGAIYALVTAACLSGSANLVQAIVSFSLFTFGSSFVLPALYVGIQMLTPDRFRGVAASFNMMVYTLCGLGLGPPAVGVISDLLPAGEKSLGVAVVIVEAAMAGLIVLVALVAQRSFHAKMLSVL